MLTSASFHFHFQTFCCLFLIQAFFCLCFCVFICPHLVLIYVCWSPLKPGLTSESWRLKCFWKVRSDASHKHFKICLYLSSYFDLNWLDHIRACICAALRLSGILLNISNLIFPLGSLCCAALWGRHRDSRLSCSGRWASCSRGVSGSVRFLSPHAGTACGLCFTVKTPAGKKSASMSQNDSNNPPRKTKTLVISMAFHISVLKGLCAARPAVRRSKVTVALPDEAATVADFCFSKQNLNDLIIQCSNMQ